jgi:hypothetical protein
MSLSVRSMTTFSFVAAIAGSLSLGACAPMQTYPPTSGSATFATEMPPTPALCATAIKAAHKKSTVADQPIVFNLPPGMNEHTWNYVAAQLPSSARAATIEDRQVISVEEVRFDGGIAEVDVIVPMGEVYQLWTCHMTGSPIGPWKVDYVQPWTLRTGTPVCNAPGAATASRVTTGSER